MDVRRTFMIQWLYIFPRVEMGWGKSRLEKKRSPMGDGLPMISRSLWVLAMRVTQPHGVAPLLASSCSLHSHTLPPLFDRMTLSKWNMVLTLKRGEGGWGEGLECIEGRLGWLV